MIKEKLKYLLEEISIEGRDSSLEEEIELASGRCGDIVKLRN